MTVHEHMRAAGIELPSVPVPVASYVPVRRVGDLLFTSGQTPTVNGELQISGKLGASLSVEEGQRGTRMAVLNNLAALNAELGSLDEIAAVVKLTGYVASAEGFGHQPQVVNGGSTLLQEVFGDVGKHARAALGVAELPFGAPVETELVVQAR